MTDQMPRMGVTMLTTWRGLHPARFATEVEERELDGIWIPEHSHIPASRRTPFPGASAKLPELPDVYWNLNGQLTSLAMAAAVTTRITLGTAVTLIAQHDPIWLAKELATLDHHSGGRVELGVGFGWNREELEDHGIDWTSRRARAGECVEVMRRLWTDEEAAFDGEHFSLEPSWANPKPAQAGGPPVLLGSELGPRTIAAMAQWCDGWMPILKASRDLPAELAAVRAGYEAAGRDPDALRVTGMNAPTDPASLADLASLGVDTVAFTIWEKEPDGILRALDRFAEARRVALGL
jgi:probable F420-dependent oxidoreductase